MPSDEVTPSESQPLEFRSFDSAAHLKHEEQFLKDQKRSHGNCSVLSACRGPDGSLWTGAGDWAVRCFKPTGELVKTCPGHTAGVRSIQPIYSVLWSGSLDKTIRVWEPHPKSKKCLRTLTGHTGGVHALETVGDRVWSASGDASIMVWDIETGGLLQKIGAHHGSVYALHRDGSMVWSGSADNTLNVWDQLSGRLVRSIRFHNAAVRCLELVGPYIWSGSSGSIVVVDSRTGQSLVQISGDAEYTCMSIVGEQIFVGASDGTLTAFDAKTAMPVYSLNAHAKWVSGLVRCKELLWSTSWDQTMKCWQLDSVGPDVSSETKFSLPSPETAPPTLAERLESARQAELVEEVAEVRATAKERLQVLQSISSDLATATAAPLSDAPLAATSAAPSDSASLDRIARLEEQNRLMQETTARLVRVLQAQVSDMVDVHSRLRTVEQRLGIPAPRSADADDGDADSATA